MALLAGGALAAEPAHLITPGQGIGPINLGAPLARATAALGRYKSSVDMLEGPVRLREYRWYASTAHDASPAASGFALTCLPDGRITQVSVRYLPAYVTEKNLHTSGPGGVRGSSLLGVQLAMGSPGTATLGEAGMRKMEYGGIRFWIDTTTQLVARIDVF
ncbi:MAG TPA: hypothetical protein VGX97_05940 [bacterium]|nr:hypothetical protein [bacterium]